MQTLPLINSLTKLRDALYSEFEYIPKLRRMHTLPVVKNSFLLVVVIRFMHLSLWPVPIQN